MNNKKNLQIDALENTILKYNKTLKFLSNIELFLLGVLVFVPNVVLTTRLALNKIEPSQFEAGFAITSIIGVATVGQFEIEKFRLEKDSKRQIAKHFEKIKEKEKE